MRALRGRAAAVFAPREGQRKKHTTRIFPRFFINARLAPAACGTQKCFPQAARFHRTACSRRGPPRRPGFTENASGPLRANANPPGTRSGSRQARPPPVFARLSEISKISLFRSVLGIFGARVLFFFRALFHI
ncbi:hypothetical protein [Cloacibacillus sp. An23]|uniref:hypothetical protein n=1 Tax=Cloacibacillus sp. An23 TaxID=1965591 RepID=UPI000B3711B6|nr:hypothetical protein [Cloacibacillus sp. An23]OUO94280.1 hypothetical protein B5F39_03400 [Cloacibacillus sp. An23]